jgi:hypothetical protein
MPSMKVSVKRKTHPSVILQLWEVIIKIENPSVSSFRKGRDKNENFFNSPLF